MARPLHHAVVAGGSIAGLLATRVLAQHFERVTLIERDNLARTPESRKGVPQGRHGHVLLLRGQAIMERLFPTLCADLLAAGAIRVSSGRDFAWHHAGAWRVQFDSDLSFLSMSRPLLETTIAGLVGDIPNVAFEQGVRVEGLKSGPENAVTGVHVRSVGSPQATTDVEAGLVVEATGRGSATPQWLRELHFDPPATEQLRPPSRTRPASFAVLSPCPTGAH